MDKHLVLIQLHDMTGNYQDTIIKTYGNNYVSALGKLSNIDINNFIKENGGYSDDHYNFEPISYYDIDLVSEVK